MNTISFQPYYNAPRPRFGSSLTATARISGTTEGPFPIVRHVALDLGNMLRIRNGRGTRVRVASGVLWVTEENSPEDHVLLPGDAIELTQTGTAIVLAHRVACVVVEVPAGVTPPRAVEMALSEGEAGVRISLADRTSISPSAIAGRIGRAIAGALASIWRT